VEATKVTEIVDRAHACEAKESTELVDEFCPDSAYQAGKPVGKEVTFTFLCDSFPEIFPGIDAKSALKVRVEPLSADHVCTLVLHPFHIHGQFSSY
jgi:hypothetical protein